jgi:uncharacterized protein (TIGR00290 family)
MDSTKKKRVTISWSGGKDSAFALYKILASGEYDVVSLHTIFNHENQRVGLHGVHENLIETQARSIGIPLIRLYLHSSESNGPYEVLMKTFYEQCSREQIAGVVFGDIFLEDLKLYRNTLIKDSGLQPIFPLWQIDSSTLLSDIVNAGFKTMICSADAVHFGKKHLGLPMDHELIGSLPRDVDPCGERGEYHTFVFDGPIFQKPVQVSKGDIVLKWYDYQMKDENDQLQKQRTSFWFQELLARTDA